MSYTILLLDDDTSLLQELSAFLRSFGFEILSCSNVEEAVSAVDVKPDFAVVDLYLNGDCGASLSNEFVRKFLIAKSIPYGRLTSAPSLVPEQFSGCWVAHKRLLRSNPDELVSLIKRSLCKV